MRNIMLRVCAFSAVTLLILSGCMVGSVTDMYSLPRPSERHLRLLELLDGELSAGSEFASPSSGDLRQSVQLHDLDLDGTDEAIAFFRDSDDVLKICVYRVEEDEYRPALTINGAGTSIGRVEYADLNGDGAAELIVSWQMGDFCMLNVYSMENFEGSSLLTADCVEFRAASLFGDGLIQLAALRFDGVNPGGMDLYTFAADGETASLTAPLSRGIAAVDRLRLTELTDSVPALFVESFLETGELVTDVFTYDGEHFKNITLDASDVSSARRAYTMFSTDINGDGRLEIPSARLLQNRPGDEGVLWAFDWYGYDAMGGRNLTFSTYHSVNDGWYFILPESVSASLSVRRESRANGERRVILSSHDGASGKTSDFLAIFTLTGENRYDQAEKDGRFILTADKSAVFAAEILDPSVISRDRVKADFKLINAEWFVGALQASGGFTSAG